MSFTKVRTAWAANSTLTSAEIQTLDADHANAADKTTAGDTIAGTWTFPSGSGISAQAGSTFAFAGALTISGTSNLIGTGFSVGDGTTGAGTLTIASNGTLVFNASSTLTIKTTAYVTGVGRLSTQTGGRFSLGDSDYVLLGVGHSGITQVRKVPFGALNGNLPSGWTYSSTGQGLLSAPNPPSPAPSATITLPLGPATWANATLTTVKLLFTPSTSHASLPANNISASLKVFTPTVGTSATPALLGAAATYVPGPLGDYNSGVVRSLTILAGSPVIDPTQNVYLVTITDENGGMGFGQTIYHGLELTYTIADLRPQ